MEMSEVVITGASAEWKSCVQLISSVFCFGQNGIDSKQISNLQKGTEKKKQTVRLQGGPDKHNLLLIIIAVWAAITITVKKKKQQQQPYKVKKKIKIVRAEAQHRIQHSEHDGKSFAWIFLATNPYSDMM